MLYIKHFVGKNRVWHDADQFPAGITYRIYNNFSVLSIDSFFIHTFFCSGSLFTALFFHSIIKLYLMWMINNLSVAITQIKILPAVCRINPFHHS